MNRERIPIAISDPIFGPGSSHSAKATLTVAPSGLACTFELFLSKDGGNTKATDTSVNFTSTGAAQDVTIGPITMPSTAGYSYGVYIDVLSGGQLLAAYVGTDPVVIPSVSQPVITWT
jgi:hypothetical protein